MFDTIAGPFFAVYKKLFYIIHKNVRTESLHYSAYIHLQPGKFKIYKALRSWSTIRYSLFTIRKPIQIVVRILINVKSKSHINFLIYLYYKRNSDKVLILSLVLTT